MKANINGIQVEGTPQEIAELMELTNIHIEVKESRAMSELVQYHNDELVKGLV